MSKVFKAAAEEIGEEIVKVVRACREAGIPEAEIARRITAVFDSVESAFPADAFAEIKSLAMEYAERETSKLDDKPVIQAFSR